MKKSKFVSPYKDASSATPTIPSVNPLAKKSTTTSIPTTKKTTTTNKPKVKDEETSTTETTYFKVMWCAKTTKKHKSYNDGYLKYNESCKTFNLYDDCGKDIGKNSLIKIQDVTPDANIIISAKEVVVESVITSSQFEKSTGLESSIQQQPTTTTTKKLTKKEKEAQEKRDEKEAAQQPQTTTTTTTTTTSSGLKKEFKSHTSLEEQKSGKKVVCRHDPTSKDALILYTPPESQLDEEGNKVVHVVCDPYISKHLRPHQRRGVKFLYDCVTGVSNNEGYTGAILADQMGLGKTLQTLALVWTLLKQSPHGKSMIKKAIIVTPSTLVNNWKKEIQKWFGVDRLMASTLTDSLSKETRANLNDFNTSIRPVLIISYEQCRIFAKELETMTCGLMVCDEAHRLKNSNAKTTIAINSVKADRKILLTGTPIQNDLSEFWAMVDFCNPGCLGSLSDFKKNFITPIYKSRESGNTTAGDGLKKSIQLSKLTRPYILRRKSNILEKYLPPKRVIVLFCNLSKLQSELYKSILNSNSIQSILLGNGGGSGGRGSATSLSTITLLKKLCNSPSLLLESEDKEIQSILKKYNYTDQSVSVGGDDNESGKLQFIENLIIHLKSIGEKVVLVSNYTQTLDVFEKLCKRLSVDTLRLDGTINADHRQPLVDRFNDPSNAKSFTVFLLSAKAGGVGINLIGGNHLVLYDPDWNPAIDIQAMERIWREGQMKPVYIYRLFSTGTIEEKIYQRQLMKESISNSIVDKKYNDNGGGFSIEDLKDIFSYNEVTNSDTHDLLQCSCGNGNGSSVNISKKNQIFKTIQHTEKWDHFKNVNQFNQKCTHDSVLKKLKQTFDPISFIFISKNSKPLSNFEDDENENENDEISFLETDQDIPEEEEQQDEQQEKVTNSPKSKKRLSKQQQEEDDEEEEEEKEEEPKSNLKKRKTNNNIVDDDDEDNLSDLEF